MQTFIIATFASASLAMSNTMVSQKLAQLEVPPPRVIVASPYDELRREPRRYYRKPDIKKHDVIVKGDGYLGNVQEQPDALTLAQSIQSGDSDSTEPQLQDYFTDPILVFQGLTGITIPRFFRQGTAIAYDLYEVYALIDLGVPIPRTQSMLLGFEMMHAVMDLFCTQKSCNGDIDLIANDLENMSEDDIDIAINMYNVADRHEVVLFEDEKLLNELIEEIANETGLTKQNVEDVNEMSRELSGEFIDLSSFLPLLKSAKQLLKDGKEINKETLYLDEGSKNPFGPLLDQTRQLMEAIKSPADLLLPEVDTFGAGESLVL